MGIWVTAGRRSYIGGHIDLRQFRGFFAGRGQTLASVAGWLDNTVRLWDVHSLGNRRNSHSMLKLIFIRMTSDRGGFLAGWRDDSR